MTQAQNMQKRYVTPALTVYGRLEDVTMIWSNPTSTDNTCAAQAFQGSQVANSGTLCLAGGGGGGGSAPDSINGLPVDLSLVDPELAEELTGLDVTGDGSGGS